MYIKETPSFKTHVVRSFEDYLNVLKLIRSESKDKPIWFRGQENASYRLVPSAMRECFEIEDQFGREINPKEVGNDYNNKGNVAAYINVHSMLEDFKKLASEHLRINQKMI